MNLLGHSARDRVERREDRDRRTRMCGRKQRATLRTCDPEGEATL
jgi:hypothetical protein